MTNDITIYRKGEIFDLCIGLNTREYACQCRYNDCVHISISDRLIAAFALVRKYYASPINITSGFRCQRHNSDVGGHVGSFHKLGAAIDIAVSPDKLEELKNICELYFDKVIYYNKKGFIHCQLGELNED